MKKLVCLIFVVLLLLSCAGCGAAGQDVEATPTPTVKPTAEPTQTPQPTPSPTATPVPTATMPVMLPPPQSTVTLDDCMRTIYNRLEEKNRGIDGVLYRVHQDGYFVLVEMSFPALADVARYAQSNNQEAINLWNMYLEAIHGLDNEFQGILNQNGFSNYAMYIVFLNDEDASKALMASSMGIIVYDAVNGTSVSAQSGSSGTALWKQAYSDYISTRFAAFGNDADYLRKTARFYLNDFDGDGTPELFIEYNHTVWGESICTFNGQSVQATDLVYLEDVSGSGIVSCIPNSGYIRCFGYNQGYKCDVILKVSGGNISVIGQGRYMDYEMAQQYGYGQEEYYWNNEAVRMNTYFGSLCMALNVNDLGELNHSLALFGQAAMLNFDGIQAALRS